MPSKNGTQIGSARVITFRRDEDFQKRKIHYGRSIIGVREANLAVRELIEIVSRRCEEISANDHSPVLQIGEDQGTCFLRGIQSTYMTIHWHSRYKDSLEGSKLKVDIYDGPPSLCGHMIPKEAKRIRALTFTFGLSSQNRSGFFEGNEQYNPRELAEKLINWYMDEASKLLQRRRR